MYIYIAPTGSEEGPFRSRLKELRSSKIPQSGVISISNKSMFDSHLHLLYLQLQLHEYPYLCWHNSNFSPFGLVVKIFNPFHISPVRPPQVGPQEHGRTSVRPGDENGVVLGRNGAAIGQQKNHMGLFQRGIPPNGHQIIGRTMINMINLPNFLGTPFACTTSE